MLKFKNQKHVPPLVLEHFKDFGNYILDKFFNKNLRKKLDITVTFKKNLYKDENIWGCCIWEDTHYRPKVFSIDIDPDQKLHVLMDCFAHEMVHVKQWAKGEYYQTIKNNKIYVFNKAKIDTNKVKYWDQPWEIEAHGRAIGLVVQWAQDRKINEGVIQE
jgi:hypothetical protein